jgi:hypothetical protein
MHLDLPSGNHDALAWISEARLSCASEKRLAKVSVVWRLLIPLGGPRRMWLEGSPGRQRERGNDSGRSRVELHWLL